MSVLHVEDGSATYAGSTVELMTKCFLTPIRYFFQHVAGLRAHTLVKHKRKDNRANQPLQEVPRTPPFSSTPFVFALRAFKRFPFLLG